MISNKFMMIKYICDPKSILVITYIYPNCVLSDYLAFILIVEFRDP